MRRFHRRRGSSPRLLIAVILLGLLMVPVECAMVHGPHSIFLPPRALAAPAASLPAAEPNHHHHDHAQPPAADGPAPTQPAVGEAPAGAMLAATEAWLSFAAMTATDAAAVAPAPRLAAAVDTAAAPGVPAVLLGAALLLGPPTTEPPLWPAAAVPRGQPETGPEPPPP